MPIAKNILLIIVIMLVTLGSVAFLILHHEDGEQRVIFNLQDTQGNSVTHENLWGKWSIVTFGFVSCPDICPTHAAEVAKSLNVIQSKASVDSISEMDIQAVFISVDYVRDTADILDRYLKYFHSEYIGYLGSRSQLDLAVESFKGFYSVTKAPNEADLNVVDVVHSSLIYIIDPNGQIVKQLPFGVSGMEIADQMFELMELKIALQQNKAALGALASTQAN